MAKKKKLRKRNRASRGPATATGRPPVSEAGVAQPVAAAQAMPLSAVPTSVRAAAPLAAPSPDVPRWAYVRGDLRRLGVLALACIAAEVVLRLLFSHTGLGNTIYGLIKL